jgi:Nucleotide modification associated domain 2
MVAKIMKLFAYIVRHDSGFSPNPFGGLCTLACCKPSIRRCAEPGDTVIGTGSARCRLSGHLVYAMRIKAVLPFDEYWASYPSKRPSSETAVKSRGDNIWHCDVSGKWRCVPGAFHDEDNQARDLSGCNALISSDFYYFGRDAILIPHEFRRLLATTRGHKNSVDIDLIAEFWDWLKFIAPKGGRIGMPFDFDESYCGGCECNRMAARHRRLATQNESIGC